MTNLSPEAREEVREFLRKERQAAYIVGGVSFGTMLLIIGGLLSFMWTQVEVRSELVAQNAARQEIATSSAIRELQRDTLATISDAKEQVGEARGRTEEHLNSAAAALAEIKGTLRQFKDAEKSLSVLKDLGEQQDILVRTILADPEIQDLFVAQIGNLQFPKNAVVAFRTSEQHGACPGGWSVFREAGGRVIVGAGPHENFHISSYPSFVDDPLRATGGEERVTLKEAHMPRHTHGIPRQTDGGATGIVALLARGHSANVEPLPTTEVGESEPHNNMPPFIALYFCKKD